MSPNLYLLVGLILGSLFGGCIGWLWAGRRSLLEPADTRVEDELRQQLEQRESAVRQLRDQLLETAEDRAAAEARQTATERLLAEQRQLHDTTIHDLREAFQALSAEALKRTQPEFLRLAQETLARFHESAQGDLARRQESIANLVKPLQEQLKLYQERLHQAEVAQSSHLGEVKAQLETLAGHSQSLSQETRQLRQVLGSNQARGRWGEDTLRRVVEAAGMSRHCDFTEQAHSGDGKPDMVVRLPGDRLLIIDAKVPDLEFLDTLDAAAAARRKETLAAHASKLKQTIKALAERDYPRQFPQALDHVVLFLPAESLFSSALEGDPDLLLWAADRRILLTTPASLIALLRTVSLTWQQHAQNENARAISEAAQELFTRLSRFSEHLEKIRNGLDRANQAFNEAVGSYDRILRPAGEKLMRLGGAAPGKEIVELRHIESELRPVAQRSPESAPAPEAPGAHP
jgi:DNA recombination protein RmuC